VLVPAWLFMPHCRIRQYWRLSWHQWHRSDRARAQARMSQKSIGDSDERIGIVDYLICISTQVPSLRLKEAKGRAGTEAVTIRSVYLLSVACMRRLVCRCAEPVDPQLRFHSGLGYRSAFFPLVLLSQYMACHDRFWLTLPPPDPLRWTRLDGEERGVELRAQSPLEAVRVELLQHPSGVRHI
jgi:hypothetical protein